MIPPQQLSPQAFSLLVEYLRDELWRAIGERRPLEERWVRWHRQYKAIPEFPVKKFPFLGAANLVLPIGATDVDTIFSRLSGILFGPDHLWSTRALRPDAVQYAPRLQEFLKWAEKNELDAYRSTIDWLLELCKLGTGVLKQRYRREQKLVYEFRETPQGAIERQQRLNIHDSPQQSHVSLYNFLVPTGAVDHQEAAWCGERLLLDTHQLDARRRAGIYMNVETIQAWLSRDRGSWVQDAIQGLQQTRPGLTRQVELWECWLDFDIQGIGEPQAVVCTLHLPTGLPLRVDFNPFFHQERPFEVARYQRVEKSFYGIGILEMDEMFQDEVTAMHNQRLDAGTIGNAPMIKARRGSGVKEDEPIFVGRWVLVDSMDDIEPMSVGRALGTTVAEEQATLAYSRQRVGVNDYVMGNNAANIGYATAQTNIMQHTEAAKRFDQTLREARAALGNSGRRCVELYQQFNQGGKPYTVLGEADGAIVDQVLHFPLELIRHSVSVEVTATSASLNKEVQIRTNTILMQLVAQFYEQTLQALMLASNPQLPPLMQMVAAQSIVGNSVLMKRLLDSYEMQDIDEIIPDLQELVNGQQHQLGQLGAQGGAWPQASAGPLTQLGGGAGPAGPLPASGMATF